MSQVFEWQDPTKPFKVVNVSGTAVSSGTTTITIPTTNGPLSVTPLKWTGGNIVYFDIVLDAAPREPASEPWRRCMT